MYNVFKLNYTFNCNSIFLVYNLQTNKNIKLLWQLSVDGYVIGNNLSNTVIKNQ